jgi:hypothetical protein
MLSVLCISYNTHALFSNFTAKLRSLFSSPISKLTQTKTVSPNLQVPEYDLNFMWINKQKKEEQKTLAPEAINKDLIRHIARWAQVNPKAKQVNLWYDSAMETPQAIENTKKEIIAESAYNPKTPAIILKDIRDLPEVKEHPEVFSDKIPVFFRVDLLRAIATHDTLSNTADKKTTAFVYADLDLPPTPEQKIFDAYDLINLRNYGMVMAQDPTRTYENSFQITSNNKNLLEALQTAVIKPNIHYAQGLLSQRPSDKPYQLLTDPNHYIHERIYTSYPGMFKYLYTLKNMGALNLLDSGEIYKKELHGVTPFIKSTIPFMQKIIPSIREENMVFTAYPGMPYWPGNEYKTWMPVKSVPIIKKEGTYRKRSMPE